MGNLALYSEMENKLKKKKKKERKEKYLKVVLWPTSGGRPFLVLVPFYSVQTYGVRESLSCPISFTFFSWQVLA
jgi:hypothetical protein